MNKCGRITFFENNLFVSTTLFRTEVLHFTQKVSSRNSCIAPSGYSELIIRSKSVLNMVLI
jgi:hypothetical protein